MCKACRQLSAPNQRQPTTGCRALLRYPSSPSIFRQARPCRRTASTKRWCSSSDQRSRALLMVYGLRACTRQKPAVGHPVRQNPGTGGPGSGCGCVHRGHTFACLPFSSSSPLPWPSSPVARLDTPPSVPRPPRGPRELTVVPNAVFDPPTSMQGPYSLLPRWAHSLFLRVTAFGESWETFERLFGVLHPIRCPCRWLGDCVFRLDSQLATVVSLTTTSTNYLSLLHRNGHKRGCY